MKTETGCGEDDEAHNDGNKMDLTGLMKEITKREIANPITFILHKMKNTSRHFTRNESHNWLRQCTGQPKLRKRVRSQAGVDDSCFCSQLRSKTNNGDTDFNIDRHEKEQLQSQEGEQNVVRSERGQDHLTKRRG